MKGRSFSFIFLLVAVGLHAADEPRPLEGVFHAGDTVTLTGELVLFNGWPPNVRFVVEGNRLVGIGTGEDAVLPCFQMVRMVSE